MPEILGGLSLLLAVSDNSYELFLDCEFIFNVCEVCICMCVFACTHIYVYVCVRMSLHVCTCVHKCVCAYMHVQRSRLAWVEGAAAQFGLVSTPATCSRCHQSGTKFFVNFLAWGFPSHVGSSHLNLKPMEDRRML